MAKKQIIWENERASCSEKFQWDYYVEERKHTKKNGGEAPVDAAWNSSRSIERVPIWVAALCKCKIRHIVVKAGQK